MIQSRAFPLGARHRRVGVLQFREKPLPVLLSRLATETLLIQNALVALVIGAIACVAGRDVLATIWSLVRPDRTVAKAPNGRTKCAKSVLIPMPNTDRQPQMTTINE